MTTNPIANEYEYQQAKEEEKRFSLLVDDMKACRTSTVPTEAEMNATQSMLDTLRRKIDAWECQHTTRAQPHAIPELLAVAD